MTGLAQRQQVLAVVAPFVHPPDDVVTLELRLVPEAERAEALRRSLPRRATGELFAVYAGVAVKLDGLPPRAPEPEYVLVGQFEVGGEPTQD